MTQAVFDTWIIRGVDGPPYKVGPRCANPTCNHFVDYVEQHHMTRRSKISGAFDWIEVDGIGVVANKTGLCLHCHRQITDDEKAIRYDHGLFVWCDVEINSLRIATYTPIAPLFPQPPTPESLAEQTSGKETESEHCPTCGQNTRRRALPALPPGERRRRKTWNVSVPADAEEDGAEALDVLVDDLAPLLGYHAEDTKEKARLRYYVLVPTLYFAHVNRKEFVESIKGVG